MLTSKQSFQHNSMVGVCLLATKQCVRQAKHTKLHLIFQTASILAVYTEIVCLLN